MEAKAVYGAATDTVTIRFSREALFAFIEEYNAAHVRKRDGKYEYLSLDEYAPGEATLIGTAYNEPRKDN